MKIKNWENTGFTKEETKDKTLFVCESDQYSFDSEMANNSIPEDIPIDTKAKILINAYKKRKLQN